MVPLFTLLWGPVEALGTMMVLGVASTAQLLPPAIKHASWNDTVPMLIGSMLLSPVGAMLLVTLDPVVVKKLIAILLLIITLITISGWQYKGPRGLVPAATAGALGGLINGVAGVGGPPLVLYLISLPGSAQTHRANIVMAMAVTSLAVLVSFFFAGAVTTRVITHVIVLFVPSVISVWFGAWLFTKLPSAIFKLVVLWFLVAISIAILLT